jgi:hypothetical protein
LRVCAGAVSSEQRKSNGSSAAAVAERMAGDAMTVAAEARKWRRDQVRFMCFLLRWAGGQATTCRLERAV